MIHFPPRGAALTYTQVGTGPPYCPIWSVQCGAFGWPTVSTLVRLAAPVLEPAGGLWERSGQRPGLLVCQPGRTDLTLRGRLQSQADPVLSQVPLPPRSHTPATMGLYPTQVLTHTPL